MRTVRTISQGAVDNVDAFKEFARRMCAHVEKHEPGMVSYECFADSNGQVLWVEEYGDEDAFLAHVAELTSSGLLDELMRLYTIEKITWLGNVVGDGVKDVLEQFGAAQLAGVGGFTRQ